MQCCKTKNSFLLKAEENTGKNKKSEKKNREIAFFLFFTSRV